MNECIHCHDVVHRDPTDQMWVGSDGSRVCAARPAVGRNVWRQHEIEEKG